MSSQDSSTHDNKELEEQEIDKLMNVEYTYPEHNDPSFQDKIYKKREFYFHKMPERPIMDKYEDVDKYRTDICINKQGLLSQQAFLSNYINPNTPYRGVLIFHGVGTGKCVLGKELVNVNGQLIRMDNLWNKCLNNTNNSLIDDTRCESWIILGDKLSTKSLSEENMSIVNSKVTKLYKQYVNEPIITIVLDNGLEITKTNLHSLYNHTLGIWTNNIAVGDSISVVGQVSNQNATDEYFRNAFYYISLLVVSDEATRESRKASAFLTNVLGIDGLLSAVSRVSQMSKYDIYVFLKNLIKLSDKQRRKNTPDCEISNNDKYILFQIYYLLKMFGIESKIKCVSLNMYTLTVNSNDKNKFTGDYDNLELGEDIPLILPVKVKDIIVRDYVGYVYDMEVENTHNYICNGIFTHNTCAGISIAEQFKPIVKKYNTKIHVLVPGPFIKENWKSELLKYSCTKETYFKQQDVTVYNNKQNVDRLKKNAINIALQYYKFLSYKSFYKKVLGTKIKIMDEDSKKAVYRKTDEGKFERELSLDRIYNLNNSVIIVDEAHQLTNNFYGEALLKVIKESRNLRVVLMTATPMKNLADDVVELINFIRPVNSPMLRDKIFTNQKNYEMQFKEDGIDYLKKMTNGYVSYLRGADPLTFAKRIDKGTIPDGLLFTRVVRCKMLPFQRQLYDKVILEVNDSLDRKSEAVANFIFPGVDSNNNLVGFSGREGIIAVRNQLDNKGDIVTNKIATELLKDKTLENSTDLIRSSDVTRNVTGKILNVKYLQHFSTKFYTALKKLNKLVWGKKGARTGFVYSNLVRIGIELFQEVLLMNGYLEYQEDKNYNISPDTRCYFCGIIHSEHSKIDSKIPDHQYSPATFIVVTGNTSDDVDEYIPEEKIAIIQNVFSNINNIDGKDIKLVLGSRVINEGISMFYVSEVHILDVYFNLNRVEQVIGRALRHCSHYHLMSKENPNPQVRIYKYVVAIENGLTSEEEMYKKAELKFVLIKKVERALKESAIDCPLNRISNIFPEEMEEYKDCVKPLDLLKPDGSIDPKMKGKKVCSVLCDYMECDFKCNSTKLNEKYLDKDKNKYLPVKNVDYSTFNNEFARSEIDIAKTKIKEMYRVNYLYTLNDITNYVKNEYVGNKKNLFNPFFTFKALHDLIPRTENEFNNFSDTIIDKYNRHGYLIHIDKYYIFQPFDQNENVPMHYRTVYNKRMRNDLTLYNYLKIVDKLDSKNQMQRESVLEEIEHDDTIYNFDDVIDYYEKRGEFIYVGTVDKESNSRKSKNTEDLEDVFKIRKKRTKSEKQRGTGIVTMFGTVCGTGQDKNKLLKIADQIGIKIDKNKKLTKSDICLAIKKYLLFMEKYSTTKNKNKITYVIVPYDHPEYPFPYNLEDRKEYIIEEVNNKIKSKMTVDNIPKKIDGQNVLEYRIKIQHTNDIKEHSKFLKSIGFQLEGKNWIKDIN